MQQDLFGVFCTGCRDSSRRRPEGCAASGTWRKRGEVEYPSLLHLFVPLTSPCSSALAEFPRIAPKVPRARKQRQVSARNLVVPRKQQERRLADSWGQVEYRQPFASLLSRISSRLERIWPREPMHRRRAIKMARSERKHLIFLCTCKFFLFTLCTGSKNSAVALCTGDAVLYGLKSGLDFRFGALPGDAKHSCWELSCTSRPPVALPFCQKT